MRRSSVNIELIILIIVYETAALLKYSEVSIVTLRQEVEVVAVRELRAHLHRGPAGRVEPADRVHVRPVAFLTALAEPDLRASHVRLQIIMHHVEILERRELAVRGEGRPDEELSLLGVDVEPVPDVDAYLLAHARDESVHFLVEVRGVVYDVEVGMADPRRRRVVVQFSG